ncbi:MAG TPA: hypothetical protein VFP19_02495, partial [Candidatus Limnocylindrales bacterium]|nr:hypothetical protein [Candidatus Limnocylindrales bacterium]
MALTRRSRFVVLTAGLAGVALVVALAIGVQPKGGGPRLDAPGGGSLPVTAAQSANGPVEVSPGHFVGVDQKHDRSAALRDMQPLPLKAPPARDEDSGDHAASGHVNAPDTVVQTSLAAPAMPATSTSFNGIGFPGVNCNCAPPDTNGEAGATQYVQIVNEGFQVFDKATGASVYGPAGIATVWSTFGGVCQTSGMGDPVVLYDQVAGRWLISQFAGSCVPTDECVAVSTSSDATGTWNRYAFHLGSNFFDYPHLGVWTDGYYMSMNVFNSSGTSFLGPQAFAFDRTAMLAGQAATFVTPGNLGSSAQPILPADLDGSTLPPAGAAESFVAWPGDGTYRTYHYKPNFTTPANSSWTTFGAPAAAGFTELCPTTRACV